MSDDIGPLRPAGERKVFHDRHGHVAGAMSAQAAFAAPWASATVPAETHAQDHGWRHFPAGFFPSSLETQGHCGAQHMSQMPQLHQVPLRPAPPIPQTQTPHDQVLTKTPVEGLTNDTSSTCSFARRGLPGPPRPRTWRRTGPRSDAIVQPCKATLSWR